MIKVLIGISGSGKSTWAHKMWMEDPLNSVIISRDNIRYTFGYTPETVYRYYERKDLQKLEKEVTSQFTTIVWDALQRGKTVIADNTHLNRSDLQYYEYFNVPIEYIKVDIDLDEALNRDQNRDRIVGAKVIIKQWSKFKALEIPKNFEPIAKVQFNPNLPSCYIFDIDGTIAEKGDRNPFDYSKVHEDKEIEEVSFINKILNYSPTTKTIICSGRDDDSLELSKRWMYLNGINFNEIHFRKTGDYRSDWVVKEEMWNDISKRYNIIGMFDDRLQVVRRARALGYTVFNVAYNNF